jgi:limonene-1,2-epoxide hydrolase
MTDATNKPLLSRRHLMMGASALTAMALTEAQAGGHSGNAVYLTEDEQLALEKTNDQLITNFISDYAKRDVNLLADYLADDVIYQVSEGQPEVLGKAAYLKRNGPMLDGLQKVDWITLRQFAIGQVVINDRIDEFYPKVGSRIPRMRFRVTGYFLIKDNKIQVWRDFGYPGAKQLIEAAPKA